jgi:glycosyltransferase involved in cell wall biosynthesis
MKIIQANKAYFPHLGGIETIVCQLAEGFVKQHGLESHVIVCSDNSSNSHEIINKVSITRTSTLARFSSLPISPGYPFQLLSQSGDILQLHEPFLLAPLCYLAFLKQAKNKFKRLVVWWHSDIIRQKALTKFYTPLQHSILRQADAIIVATPNHISSSELLWEFKDKCRVIPFGVDTSRFIQTPASQQKVQEIKTKYKKPIIFFSGRLIYYKGVEYLAEAMQYVPDAHLIIVGKGPLQENLESIASRCHGNVTFIPFLSEIDYVAMYQACDMFVLPSVENSEAFGIVQLEAMACAKPVITCDLPTGVTYVNKHGITGLVVVKRNSQALAEAINSLLSNPEMRLQLGENARLRVSREFTVNGMVDKTIELYKGIL